MDVVAEAIALFNKHKGSLYGFYIEALGRELAENALTRPAVVAEVFTQIIAQGYSSQELIDTARAFLDALPGAQLIQIAKTTSGSILLIRVKGFLNCFSPKFQSAERCIKIDAAFGAASGQTQTKVTPTPNNANKPVQLSKDIMDFYATLNTTDKVLWERNSKTKALYRITKRYDFKPEVCWDLPDKGAGFIAYNIDDLDDNPKDHATLGEGKEQGRGYDQIGTKETIEAIMKIAQSWASQSNQLLQIGDISRPGGINTPDHATHNTGKAFDMRPLRKSNAVAPLKLKNDEHPDYNREATKDFIRLVKKLYPSNEFYFNDSKIYNDAEFKNFVGYSAGHFDHLHVMFPGGKE